MKKKKFNPELLKEEIGKFKFLTEYDFYQEKKEIPEYKDLILGYEQLEEADEAPSDLKPEDNANSAADKVAADLGVDAGDADGEESTSDIPEPDAPAEEPTPEPAAPASNDVEVDVTSLVKGSEEAKRAADMASKNSEMLLQKLTDLESRVASMSKISDKIEGLEKEIIKRNPTPVEKMEMRSLSSYPFNQKLTDYWADKGGAYDVMGKEKPKEYVLTKDDVDSSYSDANLRKSFSINDNPYDEETIRDYDEEDV
jgi:hypothetical protein